jgi:hypothetical protein
MVLTLKQEHHFPIASGSKTDLDDSEWEWNSVASPIESSFDLSKTKDAQFSIETITSQGKVTTTCMIVRLVDYCERYSNRAAYQECE